MTERSTVEILRAARERISDPGRWTKNELARERNGVSVPSWDDAACQWCAIGAAWCEAGAALGALHPAIDALANAAQELFPERIVGIAWRVSTVNDHPETTHADVLRVYDRAISLAEEASC